MKLSNHDQVVVGQNGVALFAAVIVPNYHLRNQGRDWRNNYYYSPYTVSPQKYAVGVVTCNFAKGKPSFGLRPGDLIGLPGIFEIISVNGKPYIAESSSDTSPHSSQTTATIAVEHVPDPNPVELG